MTRRSVASAAGGLPSSASTSFAARRSVAWRSAVSAPIRSSAPGDPLPGGKSKYDLNSGGPLGTDFVGEMHGSLPAAAWSEANLTMA